MSRICDLHLAHVPKVVCNPERHHIVPQAWQHFALRSERLFLPTTALVPPTCHRNVHFYIVKLMRLLETQAVEDPAAAWALLKKNTAESRCAYAGLVGYWQSGYSLLTLCEAKLYGNA